jgi:hypothetical protein
VVRYLAAERVEPPMLPHHRSAITDEAGQRLFAIASGLPPLLYARARDCQLSPQPGARSMVINGDLKELFRLLDFACD